MEQERQAWESEAEARVWGFARSQDIVSASAAPSEETDAPRGESADSKPQTSLVATLRASSQLPRTSLGLPFSTQGSTKLKTNLSHTCLGLFAFEKQKTKVDEITT